MNEIIQTRKKWAGDFKNNAHSSPQRHVGVLTLPCRNVGILGNMLNWESGPAHENSES